MKKYILLLIIIFCFWGEVFTQSNTRAIILAKATSDSSCFAINKRFGWQQFNSYLTTVSVDSLMIEMIVQHDRTIDLNQEQLIGKIKLVNGLPKTSQIVSFNLVSNKYQLRIEPNGKCYLRLTSGSLPDGNPVILPVRAVYKR